MRSHQMQNALFDEFSADPIFAVTFRRNPRRQQQLEQSENIGLFETELRFCSRGGLVLRPFVHIAPSTNDELVIVNHKICRAIDVQSGPPDN